MTEPRDLRAILRDADPAASGELTPAERARMKATVLAAASSHRPRWLGPVVLKLAAGTAVALLAILVGRRIVAPVPKPQATAPPNAVATPPAAQFVPSPKSEASAVLPAVDRRSGRPRHAHRPGPAQAATRILFTAPEGTRILWFVGTPTADEERS
jgi:hypothetical protein